MFYYSYDFPVPSNVVTWISIEKFKANSSTQTCITLEIKLGIDFQIISFVETDILFFYIYVKLIIAKK